MSHLTKAKWGILGVMLLGILFSPLLVIIMGGISLWEFLADYATDHLRWGAFLDDADTRKDKNHCPRPGLVWDERQQYWVDPERIC